MPKIIRVFPRRTNQTPTDENVRIGPPGLWEEADRIDISVAFTYDLKYAEFLENQWKHVAPVTIGGPATGMRGEEFIPGKYLKLGSVITSRGCNNKCWFCSVWKRDGVLRELKINDGYNVMDDNLLACSDRHIMDVFKMLKRQNERAKFTGGIDTKLLKQWHIDEFVKLNPSAIYIAYDTPDDLDPMIEAGIKFKNSGYTLRGRKLYCYLLMGYPKDTIEQAEKRCHETINAGFIPFAMLWKDKDGNVNNGWRRFSKEWNRPAIIFDKLKKMPKLTKVEQVNGKKSNVELFTGLYVSDIDHARIDIIRYIQGYSGRATVDLLTSYEEKHPGGGWEHQDEVENY